MGVREKRQGKRHTTLLDAFGSRIAHFAIHAIDGLLCSLGCCFLDEGGGGECAADSGGVQEAGAEGGGGGGEFKEGHCCFFARELISIWDWN